MQEKITLIGALMMMTLVACNEDLRVGLQCRDTNDCEGLVCYSDRCEKTDENFSVNIFINGDDNEDELLSPGENASLMIQLVKKRPDNSSNPSTILRNVVGTLSTTQTGVTMTNETNLQYGDIFDGSTTCGTIPAVVYKGTCFQSKVSYPTIGIASNILANTSIPFRLTLKDAEGDSYIIYFTYTVPAISQRFEVTSISVIDDNNHNHILNPGESAGLAVQLKNSGASRALDIVGTLSTSHSGVALVNGTDLQFGDIYPGDTACGAIAAATLNGDCYLSKLYYPNITISTSVPSGTSIPFKLQLKDPYSNAFSVNFSVWVQ